MGQSPRPGHIIKNVMVLKRDTRSVRELIIWVNEQMNTDVKELADLKTGAVYCQFMHKLFPTHISLSKIHLLTNASHEIDANYNLLRSTFGKLNIRKDIPLRELVRGRGHYEFLNWLHKFVSVNYHGRHYDAFDERKGKPIGLRRIIETEKRNDSASNLKRSTTLVSTNSLPKAVELAPRAQSLIAITDKGPLRPLKGGKANLKKTSVRPGPAKNPIKTQAKANESPDQEKKEPEACSTVPLKKKDELVEACPTVPLEKKDEPVDKKTLKPPQRKTGIKLKRSHSVPPKQKEALPLRPALANLEGQRDKRTHETVDPAESRSTDNEGGPPMRKRAAFKRFRLKAKEKAQTEVVEKPKPAEEPADVGQEHQMQEPQEKPTNHMAYFLPFNYGVNPKGIQMSQSGDESLESIETLQEAAAKRALKLRQRASDRQRALDKRRLPAIQQTLECKMPTVTQNATVRQNAALCQEDLDSQMSFGSQESLNSAEASNSPYPLNSPRPSTNLNTVPAPNTPVASPQLQKTSNSPYPLNSPRPSTNLNTVPAPNTPVASPQLQKTSNSPYPLNSPRPSTNLNTVPAPNIPVASPQLQKTSNSPYPLNSPRPPIRPAAVLAPNTPGASPRFERTESEHESHSNQTFKSSNLQESCQSVCESPPSEPDWSESEYDSSVPEPDPSITYRKPISTTRTASPDPTGTRQDLLPIVESAPDEPDEPDEPDKPDKPDEPDEPVEPVEPDEPDEQDDFNPVTSSTPMYKFDRLNDGFDFAALPSDSDSEDEFDDRVWDVRRQIALLKDKLVTVECILLKYCRNSRMATKKLKRYFRKQKVDEPFVLYDFREQ